MANHAILGTFGNRGQVGFLSSALTPWWGNEALDQCGNRIVLQLTKSNPDTYREESDDLCQARRCHRLVRLHLTPLLHRPWKARQSGTGQCG